MLFLGPGLPLRGAAGRNLFLGAGAPAARGCSIEGGMSLFLGELLLRGAAQLREGEGSFWGSCRCAGLQGGACFWGSSRCTGLLN